METDNLIGNQDPLRNRKLERNEDNDNISGSTFTLQRKDKDNLKFFSAARNIVLITIGILCVILCTNLIRSLKSKDSFIEDGPNTNIKEATTVDEASVLKNSNGAKDEKEDIKTPLQSNKPSTLDILDYSPAKKYKDETQNQCFCQLQGHVDDCSCSVDTVDHYNNIKIFPRLQSLLAKDYFKYFQYNPNKPCQFWTKSNGMEPPEKCMSPTCGVKPCTTEELPPGIKGGTPVENCSDENAGSIEDTANNDKVDNTLSDLAKQEIESWRDHDDKIKGFCEVDDENDPNCVHVDLTINPERYTGYSGEASRKVWRAIYQENCFQAPNSTNISNSGITKTNRKGNKKKKLSEIFGIRQERIGELCLEKRAFYRAISGLHTSITIHLSSRFPESEMQKTKATRKNNVFGGGLASKPPPFASSGEENYVPNIDLFLSRFDPDRTDGQGPFWLKNLYFVYLLELRALQKAAPFLEKHTFYTGNAEEDIDTKTAVKEVLDIVDSFPSHFDESSLFASSDSSELLKAEFREHFRNVSKVMDCVACDKCKLWGKLQITGLGTALKILFSDESQKDHTKIDDKEMATNETNVIDLTRNEIVSLFNAIGRISTSIQQLEDLREKLRDEKT